MQHSDTTATLLTGIADLLLMNGSFSEQNGLLRGKMGAALFLYNYTNYQYNDLCSNYADEILLEVTSHLDDRNLMYTDGASGIAWGIDYLFRNDFVDIPADSNIFSNLNRLLIKFPFSFNMSLESCGTTSYFFSRLRNDFDNEARELDNLLLSELIIAQIDAIDLTGGKHDRHSSQHLCEMIGKDPDLIYLTTFVENFAHAAIILKKANDQAIYPEVVSRLSNEIFNALSHIVTTLSRLSGTRTFNKKQLKFIFNRLSIGFNACSQLDPSYPCTETMDIFLDALLTLEENARIAAEKEKDEENYILLDLRSVAALSRLNKKTENPVLAGLIKSKSGKITNTFLYKDNLVSTFLNNAGQLNIGLTGLSGLGLTLLSLTQSPATDWDTAILLS